MRKTMMIEKFLAGELSPDERNSFEIEMKKNEELRDMADLHKEVNKSILENDIHNFRKLLNETYIKVFKNENHVMNTVHTNRWILWRNISIAAVLLIAFLVIGIYVFRQKIITPDEMYSRFYEPYQSDISVRSVAQTQNGLTLAIQLYQKRDYNTAFEILGNLLNNGSNNPAIRFYYGITAMELNRYETAIYQMNELIGKDQQPFVVHAEWYLGLCYLKLNDVKKAHDYFTKIANANGYYSSQAKEILKDLP
jgi:tetratricopeptide (TPR) repeat protein